MTIDRYKYIANLARTIGFFRGHDEFTADDVRRSLGYRKTSAGTLLRLLRRTGQTYICAWREDRLGRPTIPVYAFGQESDAVRRPPKTARERDRESARRKRIAAQALAHAAMDAMTRVRQE